MRSTKVSAAKESSEKSEVLARTSRAQYLLEKDRIKHEIGNLTEIREKLGLSQRKICQLLLVDPSAWTRWNKTEAPPHIYQALKWMIELRKINPDIVGPTDMSSRLDYVQSTTQSKIKDLENQVSTLERAFTLTPASNSSASDYAIEAALRAQDQRFQAEIATLKASIEQLIAKNSLAQELKAKKARVPKKKTKETKLRKVVAKKTGKTLDKRPKAMKAKVKKDFKKPANKSAKISARKHTKRSSKKPTARKTKRRK